MKKTLIFASLKTRNMQTESKLNKNETNYLDVSRFIGIYLVIFAHFMFTYQYSGISPIIYSFHMPLFIIISGILHKNISFSRKSLFNLFYALIIPYLLYSLLAFIYLLIVEGNTMESFLSKLRLTLLVENPVTGASWFFICLFWIKLFALFLNSKKSLILFSLVCIGINLLLDYFQPNFPYENIFVLRSSLLCFPFFAIGYLSRDLVQISIKPYFKIGLVIILAAINLTLVFSMGSLSIAHLRYVNIFQMYVMASSASFALLFFSQLVVPYIKFEFIKDISRGTMMIVGMHLFVMFSMFPGIFFMTMPLRKILLLSTLLLFVFYIIIKLTYSRVPILYGKRRAARK